MDLRGDDQQLRDLMARYQQGAYDAFEDLYRALHGPVRGWLSRATEDRARVEDLTQEVFLQVHRARHTYDSAYPVLPWVFAIARHVHLMDLRTRSRRPRYVSDEDVPEPGGRADAERFVEGAPVRHALGEVSADRRRALLMHHVGGWSFREIAQKLGIRESAAKLRSSRGLQQLRDLLKK
ncbi:MAG: RNA polymerase sigma factor [Acidobacteriota bacterium]